MIINYRYSASRQQDSRLIGSSVNRTSYAYPSLGVVPFTPGMQQLTDTQILNLPINGVIAGQQPDQKKATPLTGIPNWARGIWNE